MGNMMMMIIISSSTITGSTADGSCGKEQLFW
jgi:hypothetical protein